MADIGSSSSNHTRALFRTGAGPLEPIFAPRSVAVIGATDREGSVGRTVLENLEGKPSEGTVFPVNPNRSSVLGLECYPTIEAVPQQVDLAVIATPAPTVPGLLSSCAKAGVRGAIILTAGFKESGPEGAELERQITEIAQRDRIRVIGPNCLGVMNPWSGLNATFAGIEARPGSIGFLSQSGALCTAVLDWSLRANVGFSAFVSVGSMADVGWGDLIDHLGNDPRTESILIYMESVGDARRFLSAAREVALTKPIIVLKAGRTEAAAKAAASHTGSLTGSDEVLDAAFHRCGVLRVDRVAELFSMAEVLALQPRPRGRRLSILTNAGGPGVLAADALIRGGGELSPLAPETKEALDQVLPPHWSRGNPIDVLGDADPDRYAKALEAVAKDPETDGLLVILTPQAMTDPTATAERLKQHARIGGKPVLASWMGEATVTAGESILQSAGIPTFSYPDTAASAFNNMWRYSHDLRALYETPTLPTGSREYELDRAQASELIDKVRDSGREIMTEAESKRLMALYGIPIVETEVAEDEEQAVAIAERLGYPAVLKLHSETITHKTDVGGVQLNLEDSDAVRHAFRTIETSVSERAGAKHFHGVSVQPMVKLEGYELILGSSLDPQFGPVLLFGAGGELVEVLKDRSLGLPPLNTTLARRMMERTRIYNALKGVRGREPVNLAALEGLLVRFSQLVAEQGGIREIDINPLFASPDGLIALDARVVVHPPEADGHRSPQLAIRPYPSRYVTRWTSSDDTTLTLRPIRPEDEPLMVDFHRALSDETVSNRYFQVLKLGRRVAHERLSRICFIDYDRDMVLVADRRDPETGSHEILGVGRLGRRTSNDEAEFALVVRDSFQGRGLGKALLQKLIKIGRDEGVQKIVADILARNQAMQRVCLEFGFRLRTGSDPTLIRAELDLAAEQPST